MSLSKSSSPRKVLRRGLNALGVALVVTFSSHAIMASAQTAPPAPGPAPMQPGHGPMHPGGGPGGHDCGPGKMMHGREMMFKQLGLTEQQRAQMREQRKASWEKMAPLRQQMRELMQQRMKLLAAPTIDRDALEALRGKQMALADQMSRLRTEAQVDMAQILTPEQRAKAYAMMERRMQRWQHHGPGHGGPGGPGPMMQ